MLPIVVIPFPLRVVGNRVREIGIRRGHGAAVGIFLLGHVLSRGRGGDFELTRGRWVEIGTVVGKVLGEQDRCGRHGRLTLYAFEYGFKWPRSWVFHSPS